MKVKIAFLVKDPNDSWFIDELLWAQTAADDYGFDLLVYPKEGEGEGVTNYTNELALEDVKDAHANGAKGVIFCLPNVYTADPIIQYCNDNGIKMMTVDDRLKSIDPETGEIILNQTIPFLGIDAYKTGRLVGISIAQHLVEERVQEENLGVLLLANKENMDLFNRVDGAALVLEEVLGFDHTKFITVDPGTHDPVGIRSALIHNFDKIKNDNPNFQDWVVFSFNDDCTIAAVDFLNEYGISPENIFAYGINGGQNAIDKIKEQKGFRGTIKLPSDVHGYETCKYMYEWIAKNREPEKVITSSGTVISEFDLLSLNK